MTEFDVSNPDVQEARSHIHAAGVRVVALTSGRFAIFSQGIQIHAIVEKISEEMIRECCENEMRDWLASMNAEREFRGRGEVPLPVYNPEAKSAEDLGL